MSSTLDPAKLKVVELRAELGARGLDTKGNKPVLVKRLKDALEKELQEDLPDTSIADTSTEDLNTSQDSQPDSEKGDNAEKGEAEPEKKPEDGEPEAAKEPMETEEIKPPTKGSSQPAQENNSQKAVAEETPPEARQEKPEETAQEKPPEVAQETDQEKSVVEAEQEKVEEAKTTENGEAAEEEKDSKCRKSRWGDAEPEEEQQEEAERKEEEHMQEEEAKPPAVEQHNQEQKGDKRKHSSPSPDRSQRRRSRSPIKEDEPPIDNDKVQLSWYDSDLHLQVDKESFLSARPYHEGAFGYAWAGVRATHGVTSGKVCFEVKLTEELKWEDLIKPLERLEEPPRKERKTERSGREESKSDKVDEINEGGESEKKDAENESEKPEEQETELVEETAAADDKTKNGEESISEEGAALEKSSEEDAAPEKSNEESVVTETAGEEEKEHGDDKAAENDEHEKMETDEDATTPEPIPTHLFRVGWSLQDACLQLGEHKFSYGYESTARFVTDKQFLDYGSKFGVGDVVASYVDITDETVTISYAVNGVAQGVALEIPRSELPEENFAFFPHVLSRNYAFELNLGSKEEPWFPSPEGCADYVFLEQTEDKVQGPLRPETRRECEVVMMCGLPGTGKTHWVKEWVDKNPEKRYTVIGNTHLLEKMTVDGAPLKDSYRGRWSVILDKLQKCLSRLVESAAQRRRNYVIDQTNIFPSAQRRKMRPFEGFKRRAVIVVVGDEEHAKRRALQEAEDGNDVPDNAVLEMKANMSIPRVGEWLEEVEYVELGEEEARALVQKYNKQGRDAGFGNLSHNQRRDFRSNRFNRFPPNRRNEFRSGGGYRDYRNYPPNRFDRGPPRPWHSFRPAWGRNDRRDNRGPPPPPPRDWRNRGSQDRVPERNRSQSSSGSYSRSHSGSGGSGRSQSSGSWQQSSGSGYSQPSWQSQGGGGAWNQNQTGWNQSQGGWGAQNQNQWKYGGGQGGYSQNYGYPNYYYGQYAQNWSGSQQGGGAAGSGSQYDQYPQQSWMQYAQQYAQAQTNPSTNPTAPQK